MTEPSKKNARICLTPMERYARQVLRDGAIRCSIRASCGDASRCAEEAGKMGQVQGKVRVILYVYPETRDTLKDLAFQAGFTARSGRPDLGSTVDAVVAETRRTMALVKAGAKLKPQTSDWEDQTQALTEREYQRKLKRQAASRKANERRRAAERSIRRTDLDT